MRLSKRVITFLKNLDCFTDLIIRLWQFLLILYRPWQVKNYFKTYFIPRSPQLVFLDATKRFPFENNIFDYIFSEEMIEHIDFSKGNFMISECHRVLKPGGKIRITTPDLFRIIDIYNHKKSKLYEEYLIIQKKLNWPGIVDGYPNQGVFFINWACRAYGHKFIYDYETLSKVLDYSGFVNIKRYNVGESNDENLSNLEMHHKNYGSPLAKQFQEKWKKEIQDWGLIIQGEKQA